MGEQVPLVVYNKGVRTVVGMACISSNGSIDAQVAKDMWPELKDLFPIGEFVIGQAAKPRRVPYEKVTDSTVPIPNIQEK